MESMCLGARAVGFRCTTITVVHNFGHPMISCKGGSRFIVPVQIQNETFGSFHNAIHKFDAARVFLSQQEQKMV